MNHFLFRYCSIFLMLWGTLSYLTFAQEELHYVDYFGEYRSLTDKIFKKLNEQQTALLKTINQDTTIDECKELLSKDLVYISEYQAGNYQSLCFGIPAKKRIAYVEATICSPGRSGRNVFYNGYQVDPDLNTKSFLWIQLDGCIYFREPELPFRNNSNDIEVVLKELKNFWASKGYVLDRQEVDEYGLNILVFKRELNWGCCVRILFENGKLKKIQYGIKDDFFPFTGIL